MKRLLFFAAMLLSISVMNLFGQQPHEKNVSVTPISVGTLSSTLNGTSSLFFWQDRLWTCNDHNYIRLFALDTQSAAIETSLTDYHTINDMEEVAQDEEYFYLGDFGNNHTVLRNNLRIYRLAKAGLMEGHFSYDTIEFTYDGYDPTAPNEWSSLPITDYDCEAFVAAGDSLFLFTKQWTGNQSVCYGMPKTPGTYTAEPLFRINTQGMVTGAAYLAEKSMLALIGYNSVCQPFVYLLYGFEGTYFIGGRQQRLSMDLGMGHQMEGIATLDGEHYFITNEHFSRMGVSRDPQLWTLDLSEILQEYLHPDTTTEDTSHVSLRPLSDSKQLSFTLSPNPAEDWLEVKVQGPVLTEGMLYMIDTSGREVLRAPVWNTHLSIDLQGFPKGVYSVILTFGSESAVRKVVVGR